MSIAVSAAVRTAVRFIINSGLANSWLRRGASMSAEAQAQIVAMVDDLSRVHRWRRAVDTGATPAEFRDFVIRYCNDAIRRALAVHPVQVPDLSNHLVALLAMFASERPETWTRAMADWERFADSPLGRRFVPLGSLLADQVRRVVAYVREDVARDIAEAAAWEAETKEGAA